MKNLLKKVELAEEKAAEIQGNHAINDKVEEVQEILADIKNLLKK